MKNTIELSQRLQAVVGLVTPGSIVCDAGCDHGYVSIYLVQSKASPKVIAMDIRKDPLSRAREHIRQYGLESYIETRLSDGGEALKLGEADTLILAGMGGRLMQDILTRGREKIGRMKEVILQPHSELAGFRKFLRENSFEIVKEDMVYEDGKFYPMMCVVPGQASTSADTEQKLHDVYGGLLLTNRHPVLAQYLSFEREKLESLLTELCAVKEASKKSEDRYQEVLQELDRNKLAQKLYFH